MSMCPVQYVSVFTFTYSTSIKGKRWQLQFRPEDKDMIMLLQVLKVIAAGLSLGNLCVNTLINAILENMLVFYVLSEKAHLHIQL